MLQSQSFSINSSSKGPSIKQLEKLASLSKKRYKDFLENSFDQPPVSVVSSSKRKEAIAKPAYTSPFRDRFYKFKHHLHVNYNEGIQGSAIKPTPSFRFSEETVTAYKGNPRILVPDIIPHPTKRRVLLESILSDKQPEWQEATKPQYKTQDVTTKLPSFN